jgi:5-methyltetrahydrofolate--homocysteine methyltransferase
MLIVGETINTSCLRQGERYIELAVLGRDAALIVALARAQGRAGADYLDLNAGTLAAEEAEALVWLTEVVQSAVYVPICFDSANPAALAAALRVYRPACGPPIINSITGETARYAAVLPLVRDYAAKVIALAIDDAGICRDVEGRLAVARALLHRLIADGVPFADIYLDPLTFPLGATDDAALTLLQIVGQLRAEFPGLQTIAGISNISHGLPARPPLNQALVVLALAHGMDAAILDPCDSTLMRLIAATEALLGRDASCRRYLARMRPRINDY